MERQKRWQWILIVTVIALTLYNILPTVFYYAKPLKQPVDAKRSEAVTRGIAERVNRLEADALEWLKSYCKLLGIKPVSIQLNEKSPEFITLNLKSNDDAALIRAHLNRAGAIIPFVPGQLSLYGSSADVGKTVVIQRRIPLHIDETQLSNYFEFSEKMDASGQPTPLYRALVLDRALQLGISFAGPSENGRAAQAITEGDVENRQIQDLATIMEQNLLGFTKAYGETSSMAKRYFASFSQVETASRSGLIQGLIRKLEEMGGHGALVTILRKNSDAFSSAKAPWNYHTLASQIQTSARFPIQTVSLEGKNPFVESLVIDWSGEKIYLKLYADVIAHKGDQLLYDQIAFASRDAGETISPYQDQFVVDLSDLTHSKSFVAMRLATIADAQLKETKESILAHWNPTHPDLVRENFPIWDYETYSTLDQDQNRLGLVIYAPALQGKVPPEGFRMNGIYVIAKGLDKILKKVQSAPDSPQAAQFMADFRELGTLLQQGGFVGYSASSYGISSEFAGDFIFESEDYYQTVLKATRENFSVHGTRRYAVLEFTDKEQRILTENRIDNRIHEDLLKWRDDFHAAQFNLKGLSRFDVPKPTRSPLWENIKLTAVKYFRGDDRKILHWGLDLSGGKTVQIELRDKNGHTVSSEADIRQGIDELYKRVNKMGVSEVSIRQQGNFITLDFPGTQGLSAAELVKASSMAFYIVNEQLGPMNTALADASNRFLQEVWNEAVVTNRKSEAEINQIAWRHLQGDSVNPQAAKPRSQAARILYDAGFRLANPQEVIATAQFDTSESKIALYRGDDITEWHGQTHPLLIVFRNYSLEGSQLENIHAGYDQTRGNFLSFGVSGSASRDAFYAWTSVFSKEKVAGTEYETYSRGNGWRMAVILNGSVISAPTLDSPLRDSAMITGSFTQREITQLEADLKAGSLSFTPYILSEKNVSPELGSQERTLGIVATFVALLLVIGMMSGYYRFAGVIASIAVLFNLLIMWATLQNLQATMTLAGIAGIILTVGMAVDANVLVFERIREEFALTGRIASAVHAGYRKAFSAIIDSNATTVIAALILLQFNSGPIKGFAITLIIGIVSSMFTALFMTRYFFAGWVQNPEHKELRMFQWFKAQKFDFLRHAKMTLLCSSAVILLGGFFLISQKHTIFGMDFSGGYALSVQLEQKSDGNYRKEAEKALVTAGASAQEIQIRELTPSSHIQIFLSRSMESMGHPFHGMPLENPDQSNPKINWVVTALQKGNVKISPHSLQTLEKSWVEVSGQMSNTMRNAALIGLTIALLCILIYITFRFEFKYAISATICLLHDVIFTLGALAILHALKVPIQIDLNTIAALMTIVGYSLNDTIIVFDRIREDIRLMRTAPFTEIINHALNVTLSRTVMTSGTTLLVLIPLIALGGSTIFGFALVMAIGVIFGTLSSLFIAAPLMLYFHKREEKREGIVVIN